MNLREVTISAADSGFFDHEDQSNSANRRPFIRWFGDTASERARGFLEFDMASLSLDDGEAIVSASVKLFVEVGVGYGSPFNRELFHFSQVDRHYYDSILAGGHQVGAFRLLGEGELLGSNFIRSEDQGHYATASLNRLALFLIDDAWQATDKRLVLGSRIEPGGSADRRLFGSVSANPPLDWFQLVVTVRVL